MSEINGFGGKRWLLSGTTDGKRSADNGDGDRNISIYS